MAIYINPPTESKEAFLARYGVISAVSRKDLSGLAEAHLYYRKQLHCGKVFVFHVLNHGFSALAIADSPRELHYLANFEDGRPVHMYEVDVDDIHPDDIGGAKLEEELKP